MQGGGHPRASGTPACDSPGDGNDTTKKQPPSTLSTEEADSTAANQLRCAPAHQTDLRTPRLVVFRFATTTGGAIARKHFERRAGEETGLLDALRAGDETAFAELVDRYGGLMIRIARIYVGPTVAEEIVQDTWVKALRAIDSFEGRSSLKTWLFRILTNTAKDARVREGRSTPLSSLEEGPYERSVAADRFLDAERPGWWSDGPRRWALPHESAVAGETRTRLVTAIDQLPPMQSAVITLRDVFGWSPKEACDALEISESNQRVLLHRARSKVRRALEDHFDEER